MPTLATRPRFSLALVISADQVVAEPRDPNASLPLLLVPVQCTAPSSHIAQKSFSNVATDTQRPSSSAVAAYTSASKSAERKIIVGFNCNGALI